MSVEIYKLIELIQMKIYKRIVFQKVNCNTFWYNEGEKYLTNDEVLKILIRELELLVNGD